MMIHTQRIALADAIRAVRPDWQQPGIIAQLQTLEQAWTGGDAALAAFAMQTAADPNARTPAAFNIARPVATQPQPEIPSWEQPATCEICGRTEPVCSRLRERDIRFDLDPHEFITLKQAEARASKHQIRERELERGELRRSIHATPVRIEPVPPPPDPSTPKCLGCGGTLSRDEHELHPACAVPQPEQQETPA